MSANIYAIYLVNFLILNTCINAKNCSPNIAIIGGGIGGASASHFLAKLFKNNLKIDLFEADTIGGRLATIDINNNSYEAGGAVIHERNQLMKYFIKYLNLTETPTGNSRIFGIWNGDKLIFESSSYDIITVAKLIIRYGLQPVWLHRLISSMLDDFARIYDFHDKNIAFNNVTSLLTAMNKDYPELLKIPIDKYFTNHGYSADLINELVQSTLVVNYGQEINIQSFVGLVSVAGAGFSLWSVKGGNKKVPENLISQNKRVNFIPAVVEKITYAPIYDGSPQYNLFYQLKDNSEVQNKVYDVVVIATPLTHDHKKLITFKNFPKNINKEFNNEYQTTIASFITGKLKPKYFGCIDPIDDILSCNPNYTIISSVGKLCSVEGNETDVYKIFSRKPLAKGLINEMFDQVDVVKEKIWQAYPKYSAKSIINQFKLHDALYYINAIEWAASAMEMSAISGRNAAILIYNDYYKLNYKS